MRDYDVREAMRSWLSAQFAHDPNSRFVEEMCVWNGSARIDMAVINGSMHGFEIKSERDTLARLDEQMALYDQVFDRLTLVAAEKHLLKAESRVAPWWGLTGVRIVDGRLTLRVVRRAKKNPSRDKVQIARLLWKSEQLCILEKIGLAKGARSKSAEQLCTLLATSLSERALSAHVRESLKARSGWLGKPRVDQVEMPAGTN
ncbi:MULTISPECIES: sce7726 family protein [unclassified Bradyrhizobium]|uniref:sce7726 family protein n=1 Tax=unclassified Bradyrhizobium TaxID=2631580 RepID=UPI0028E2B0D1|nr:MULTISPECIES: sce7726 family protein [unclassified Bradyrhizobium]